MEKLIDLKDGKRDSPDSAYKGAGSGMVVGSRLSNKKELSLPRLSNLRNIEGSTKSMSKLAQKSPKD